MEKNQYKRLEIRPEHQEWLEKRREQAQQEIKVEPEQFFIAKFGKHFGWPGVMAILNNEIDGQTAAYLMAGADKVDLQAQYKQAESMYIGSGSTKSKQPAVTFKKMTANLKKVMEVK